MPLESEVTVQFQVISAPGAWRHVAVGEELTQTGSGFAASVDTTTDAVVVRLHELRGAIEALRESGDYSQMQESRTGREDYGFGRPRAYNSLHFLVSSY
jgi:hypothetical protein